MNRNREKPLFGDKETTVLQVRMTREDWDLIKLRAQLNRMSLSAWVRKTLVDTAQDGPFII